MSNITSRMVEERLRRFLLILAGFICVGTIVELWFTNHVESFVQLIPFILSVLGIIVVGLALARPTKGTLQLLRGVMGITILGSIFGIYEHIEHNLAFELDIRPNASVADVFLDALGGASPMLAAGILAIAGIVAIAATYYHPLLVNRTDT
ncbi:MAG: hypothetical protein AAF639_08835 [Chloroflexota bacterium]